MSVCAVCIYSRWLSVCSAAVMEVGVRGYQGFWLSATVFDGARAIAGNLPDLDLHCSRAIRSAEILGLKSPVPVETIIELAREGTMKFPQDSELYISPIFYAQTGFVVEPNPESTQFLLIVQR